MNTLNYETDIWQKLYPILNISVYAAIFLHCWNFPRLFCIWRTQSNKILL